MAAVTTDPFAVLKAGQHVVLTDDCYRRTRQFCTGSGQVRRRVSVVEAGSAEAIEAAVRRARAC
jgi:cystathionine gamma-synthase